MVCVGGATVDRTYRLGAALVGGTSNPAEARAGHGGVARNVAANLARSGVAVDLVSRVGDDAAGRALLAALDRSGIGRRGTAVAPGAATAEYVAVLAPDGELAFGLAAMAVLDGLTPGALASHADLLCAADWVFADCNLPGDALSALARRAFPGVRYRFAVDAVSVSKATRLPEPLDGIDLLFLNRDEAEAAAMRHGPAAASPADAAAALLRAGAGAVVVTLGAEGAILAQGSAGGAPSAQGSAEGAFAARAERIVRVPAVPARVVDVTGAGDALVAATLRALLDGVPLPDALVRGCRAAADAVGRDGAVGAEGAGPDPGERAS
ncbi:PfkB family carbohydrate kinase [Lichenibacterium minor]|uniref:PfkB family carbohydrate kinase n=1 Tax=Lichenibacterium minor TaxID=2316528 RepID=UPI002478811F|nr:PfkB family carbohydrate kinase [Lichenibacterium minor]